MKNKILILIGIAVFFSCKKKKSEVAETPQTPTEITYPSYMPYKVGNYWIYERFNIDTLNNAVSNGAIDSTYIEKDTLISGNRYYKFVTKNITNPNSDITFPNDIYTNYFRDSLHYIINNIGGIVFSSKDFTSILYSYSDSYTNSFLKMVDKDSIITLSIGSLKTNHSKLEITINNISQSSILRKRFMGNRYAQNIGIVESRLAFFSNSITNRERRLIRYHLN